MTIAFILALVMNCRLLWFSDKIVLASYGAARHEAEAPQLIACRELAAQARIPCRPSTSSRTTRQRLRHRRNPSRRGGRHGRDLRIRPRTSSAGVLATELST